MRHLNFLFTGVVLLALSACGDPNKPDFFSEAGRKPMIDAYLNYQSIEADLPVIRSRSAYRRYADIYRAACIDPEPDFTQTAQAFQAAGLNFIGRPGFTPSLGMYVPENSPRFLEMPADYRALSQKLKREDGLVPTISGLQGDPSNQTMAFSDGRAIGELFLRKDGYIICSLRIKTPDDDPLLAELKRVVTESGKATGEPRSTGLFGSGYRTDTPKTTFYVIGRQRRSSQSPTYFRTMYTNNAVRGL